MEKPDVAQDLALHRDVTPEETTHFLGRGIVVVTEQETMAPWRERLFASTRRNAPARRATASCRPTACSS